MSTPFDALPADLRSAALALCESAADPATLELGFAELRARHPEHGAALDVAWAWVREQTARTLAVARGRVAAAEASADVTRVSSSALPGRGSGRAADHYDILGELGGGGMGVVYRVRNRRLGREQAMKRVRALDAELERRFLRETQALMDLDHDNIVAILDWGRDEEGPWYVMPLHADGTLESRIKRGGALSERELFDLARGLAKGLERAHARGVLHRDIKPSNVLLSVGGQPKLADFGLARREDGPAGLSMTGVGMGTRFYAAPEQVDGRGADERSDVYGLGATLYAAATGERPSPIREQRLPARWRAVVLRCLAIAPEARYQSATELLDAIEAVGLARAGETGGLTPRPAPVQAASESVDAMACPACGAANAVADRFCRTCGGSLSAECPRCAGEYRVGSAHCGRCGQSLEAWREAQELLAGAEQDLARGRTGVALDALGRVAELLPDVRSAQREVERIRERVHRATRLRARAQQADADGDLETALEYWQRVATVMPQDPQAAERIARQQALQRKRELRGLWEEVRSAVAAGRVEEVWQRLGELREVAPRVPKLAELVARADAARDARVAEVESGVADALRVGRLDLAAGGIAALERLDVDARRVDALRAEVDERLAAVSRAAAAHQRRQQLRIGGALFAVCGVAIAVVLATGGSGDASADARAAGAAPERTSEAVADVAGRGPIALASESASTELRPTAAGLALRARRNERIVLAAHCDNAGADVPCTVIATVVGADGVAVEIGRVDCAAGEDRDVEFPWRAEMVGAHAWTIAGRVLAGPELPLLRGTVDVTDRPDPSIELTEPVPAGGGRRAVKVGRRFVVAGRIADRAAWDDVPAVEVTVAGAAPLAFPVDASGAFRAELELPDGVDRARVGVGFAGQGIATEVYTRGGTDWGVGEELLRIPAEAERVDLEVGVTDALRELRIVAGDREVAHTAPLTPGAHRVTLELGALPAELRAEDVVEIAMLAVDEAGMESRRSMRIELDRAAPAVVEWPRAVDAGERGIVLDLSEDVLLERVQIDGDDVPLAACGVVEGSAVRNVGVPVATRLGVRRVRLVGRDLAGRSLDASGDVEVWRSERALGGAVRDACFAARGQVAWAIVTADAEAAVRLAFDAGAEARSVVAQELTAIVAGDGDVAFVRGARGGLWEVRGDGALPLQLRAEAVPGVAADGRERLWVLKERLAIAMDRGGPISTRRVTPHELGAARLPAELVGCHALRAVLPGGAERPVVLAVAPRGLTLLMERGVLFAFDPTAEPDGELARVGAWADVVPAQWVDGDAEATVSAVGPIDAAGRAAFAVGLADGRVIWRELLLDLSHAAELPRTTRSGLWVVREHVVTPEAEQSGVAVTSLAVTGERVAVGAADGSVRTVAIGSGGEARTHRVYSPGAGSAVSAVVWLATGELRCVLADGAVRSIPE
ncbi:MAG: protein kinase [Planctomycetes bacterium]|nr:protein kinase [Planctomycetota bacterium]